MDSFKTCYGEASVNIKELIETNQRGFMKLEYYGTKKVIQNELVEYGIEIVKKEYVNNQFLQEVSNIDNVAENEADLEKLITLLKRNKVTPIGLNDIISDLVKEK